MVDSVISTAPKLLAAILYCVSQSDPHSNVSPSCENSLFANLHSSFPEPRTL